MDADALNTLRGVAIEPTYFDLRREEVNVGDVVSRIAAIGANCIRLGALSHNGRAYYPSKIVPHASGPRRITRSRTCSASSPTLRALCVAEGPFLRRTSSIPSPSRCAVRDPGTCSSILSISRRIPRVKCALSRPSRAPPSRWGCPASAKRALVAGTRLKARRVGGALRITLGEVGAHEVIHLA